MKKFTLIAFMLFSLSTFAQLVDPGFENGPEDSPWSQFSTNFGTPLCDAGCGICGGGCVPESGDWYAWFGGAGDGTEEIGLIAQIVTIGDGTEGEISFYVSIPIPGAGSDDEVVVVRMDGDELFEVSAADSADYQEYVMVAVDISDYTDGDDHVLEVYGSQDEGTSIIFDSFSMEIDGNISIGVSELLNREEEIFLYPNPASNQLNLMFNMNMQGSALVRVLNLNGQVVNSTTLSEINNGTFTLNTNLFQSGIYNLEVTNNGLTSQHRFVVAH